MQPRYPDELEITESDMDKALINARKIRDFEPLRELRELVEQSDEAQNREIILI